MYKKCMLCPRKCGVNREKGELGFCGLSNEIKIARADLHFWEEPCISGEEGSGTVFFSGCNMQCVFCQNYDISTLNKGYNITVEKLSEIFLELQDKGANNINLVTPTHFVYDIIKALDIAKGKGLGIPVVYNSGGYERIETLRLLNGYIDIYIPDMKYFSDRYSIEYSSAKNYFEICKTAVGEMVKQVGGPLFFDNGIMKKGVIVRHLMLPGLLFDSKKIIDYLYDTYKDDIFISLMSQYTPTDNVCKAERLDTTLNIKHYETMVEYLEYKGIENAFIQSMESADKKFIPEFFEA